ncbi:glutaredoxin domain-containing protein [Corynebacterium mucifaciens]|uniref:Glutaredoxin-like protein NrdH n=1 Tax=Corynebacterium mucifaciens TaxID=57171 RepID=A0A7X6LTJ5_9CORY|nr:glutaredoxin domain-containing protein [Corynebacterium mucifaciens]NKY69609.1 NrdH-redoxin [Corynebacterium mucifaciens]
MIIYSKDKCVQCKATIKRAEALGLSFMVCDAAELPEDVAALGFTQAPIVVPDNAPPFSGFRPDRLAALAR